MRMTFAASSQPALDANSTALASTDDAALQHEARGAAAAGPLAKAREGEPMIVLEVGLEADLAGWLEAMGLGPDQTLTVLRRAAFGGPIHVRTGSGGELAINATLARSILVAPLPPERRTA